MTSNRTDFTIFFIVTTIWIIVFSVAAATLWNESRELGTVSVLVSIVQSVSLIVGTIVFLKKMTEEP